MPIKAKGVGNIFITTIMGIICDNLLLAFKRKRTNQTDRNERFHERKVKSYPGNMAKMENGNSPSFCSIPFSLPFSVRSEDERQQTIQLDVRTNVTIALLIFL